MKRTDIKAKGGFTLIEVVIVLAIAALIMVIVFLGVSGAQRAQRDTQRKDTANRIIAAAQQYAGNNSGAMPANPTLLASYFNPAPVDPQTGAYVITANGNGPASAGTRLIVSPGTCNGAAVVQNLSARTYAVSIYQENGGAYCVSS